MSKTESYSPGDIERMSRWSGLKAEETQEIIQADERKRLEPLAGEETAEVISKLYEAVGPKVGCRMVEANVVLAIAGLKSLADISWLQLTESEQKRLKDNNKNTEPYGLLLHYDPTVDQLAVESLKGLERKTKTTKIPGIPIFDNRQQFGGFAEWLKGIDPSLESAKKAGLLSPETNLEIIYEGVRLGYPDRAILDYEECLRREGTDSNLEDSDILSVTSEAYKLTGNSCEFYFYLQNAKNPEIANYIQTARKILKDFYQSKVFKEIKNKTDFLEARREADALVKTAHDRLKMRQKEED